MLHGDTRVIRRGARDVSKTNFQEAFLKASLFETPRDFLPGAEDVFPASRRA
jgi:hypothetical protein